MQIPFFGHLEHLHSEIAAVTEAWANGNIKVRVDAVTVQLTTHFCEVLLGGDLHWPVRRVDDSAYEAITATITRSAHLPSTTV
jgi:hypothetical protein